MKARAQADRRELRNITGVGESRRSAGGERALKPGQDRSQLDLSPPLTPISFLSH